MPATLYWTLIDSTLLSPETAGVLSPAELAKYSAFRFPKRRDEWLLGRRAAKLLVHSLPAYERYSLDQIEVGNTAQGSPYIQLPDGSLPPDCLSISHSGPFAFCALAPGGDLRVGADLEKIEPRTETFILDYFTPAERQLVAACPAETRSEQVTLVWSAKEAMLKALGVGLRQDTRSVEISNIEDADALETGWKKFSPGELDKNRFWAGWWQLQGPFVLTLAIFAATSIVCNTVQLIEKKISRWNSPLFKA